jgi:phosphate:Na+ symporter
MMNGWVLLGGIAIFLMGTGMMEEAIRQMAGRRFKLFLKRSTQNPLKAVGSGAFVTALLQSSSVVNLFVLALVGSGVMRMRQALAVMLGANLGTTFTSWMIAMIGFNLNLESYALPVFGLSGMLMYYARNDSSLRIWARLFAGFSLLFWGLGFMQESMQILVLKIDFSVLAGYHLIVFLLAGMIITGIVQASSVTIAITLSALHSNVINIYMAAALVLGAEIGTTFKLALASYKGSAAKKRVASGNIIFNMITSLIMFLFLKPVVDLLFHQVAPSNQILTLVVFQSFVNVCGILLFFPFLNYFGNFLDRLYNHESTLDYLKKISSGEHEFAIEAMEREVAHFISRFNGLIAAVFELHHSNKFDEHQKSGLSDKSTAELYELLKRHYGELHAFVISLNTKGMTSEELERKDQLMNSIRNGMYAAKSLKDAKEDIAHLRNSSNDTKYAFYLHLKHLAGDFSDHTNKLLEGDVSKAEELMELFDEIQSNYQKDLQSLYDQALSEKVDALEIATMLNVHREIVSAYKSAVFSLKDYLLMPKEASVFDTSPGFIR